MASKKYVIQPVSLPPPARLRAHNGSRSQPVLAKNTKSLLALGPADLKKKEKETILAPLPYSPFTLYDHKDLDTKYAPERIVVEDVKEQSTPRDLEIDLKCLRDYLQNEGKFASHHISFHPFQYISDHSEEVEEGKEIPPENPPDYKAWIREMNTKLVTKRRQIRTEKKNAELANTPRDPPASSSSTPSSPSFSSYTSSSSHSSPSSPTSPTKKLNFFTLGKKKKEKKDEVCEYDDLENSRSRKTHAPIELESTKPGKIPSLKKISVEKAYGKKDAPSSVPPASELRLFQVVRPPALITPDDEEEGDSSPRASSSSSSSSSPRGPSSPRGASSPRGSSSPRTPTQPPSPSSSAPFTKSKSFSFRSRFNLPTPKPTHQSEHDMRTKRLPRNAVSVGMST